MAYLDENGLAYFKGKLDQITDRLNNQITETDTALDNLTSLIERDTASGSIVEVNAEYAAPVEKLVVNIEPQQDLHGYYNPWPAGGWVNKMPAAPESSNTVNGITYTSDGNGRYTIKGTATALTNVDFQFAETAHLISGGKLSMFNSSTGLNLFFRLDGVDQAYWNMSVANRTATISDSDAKDYNSIRVIINSGTSVNLSFSPMIYEGDTQTAFAPYSNICPISGWTGAEVKRTGKNLFRDAAEIGTAWNGSNNTARARLAIPCKPNTNYIISRNGSMSVENIYVVTSESVPTKSVGTEITNAETRQITTGANDRYIVFAFSKSGIQQADIDELKLQLELGSTATDYEPYQGETVEVTFPQNAGDNGTVYGGTLDVTNGVLTVDRAMADLGEFNYINDGNNRMYTTNLNGIAVGKSSNEIADMLLSIYKAVSNNSTHTHASDMSASMGPSGNIYIYDSRYTIASEFKAAVAGETICYKLATPITYQLTPQQLSLLKGYNAVLANTGDIAELKYQSGGFATTDVAAQMIEKSAGTKADVITETASGSIVSFSDGADGLPVKSLTVNFEPQQDLHGYDNPWPAGGGKNKLYVSSATQTSGGVTYTVNSDGCITANGQADDTNGSSFWITNRENYTLPVGDYVFSGCTGGSYSNSYYMSIDPLGKVNSNGDTAFTVSDATQMLFPRITVNPGVTVNNVVFKPMIRLATEADATFAPYSNICPISGWTGASVTRTGNNLLVKPFTIKTTSGTISDAFYIKAGTYALSFSVSNAATWRLGVRTFTEDGSYAKTNDFSPIVTRFSSMTWNKNYNCWLGGSNLSVDYGTITFPKSCYVSFLLAAGEISNSTTVSNVMLSVGNTIVPYESLNNKMISVTFPSQAGTVYGGTLTINPDRTGTLVVDRAMIDLGTLPPTNVSSDGKMISYQESSLKPKGYLVSENDLRCNRYNPTNYSAEYDNTIFFVNTLILRIMSSESLGSTAQEVQMYFQQNPCYIVYKISNPQTIPLTSTEISAILTTLYGTNNIWSDAGDVTVEYPVDTKLYIQQLTKPTEDDMTADNAIAAGTFFMIGNTLYLATAQIAAGATITPGTNATKLSLADALNQLNS